MKIKYVSFFTENSNSQLDFFIQDSTSKAAMNADVEQQINYSPEQMSSPDVPIPGVQQEQQKSCIVLSTDDCLKDYHRLKANGLTFSKEPYYLPVGLVAEFDDSNGNRFILIEERNYNDDI